jgi:hypothetical protein
VAILDATLQGGLGTLFLVLRLYRDGCPAAGRRPGNGNAGRVARSDGAAALADPAQTDMPILTVALDAGFGSIGPFNRAFKVRTGVTPTEFRRDRLGQAGPARS